MSKPSFKSWQEDDNFSAIQYLGERANQEDYSQFRFFPSENALLAILADGMGGHTSGEVASKSAVDAFDNTFKNYPGTSVNSRLGASLTEANAKLSSMTLNNPILNGMGCTLIGAYVNSAGLYWISVGDSLIYLYRSGKLNQINEDHSMGSLIAESLRTGKITKQEADNYPNKNALRSALMGSDIPLIDAPEMPLKLYSGDIIVIASDGLLTLSHNEITSIIDRSSLSSAETISNNLIEAVKNKKLKNQDNTTIQIIKVPKNFPKKPFKKTSYLAYLLAILSLMAFSLGVVFNEDVRKFFSHNINSFSSEPADVKPVIIPSEEIKKLEQSTVKKNELPGGIGNVLDKDSKKVDRKNIDDKNKKKKNPDDSKSENKPPSLDTKNQPEINTNDKDKKSMPESSTSDGVEKT